MKKNYLFAVFAFMLLCSSVFAASLLENWYLGKWNYSVKDAPTDYEIYAKGKLLFENQGNKIKGKLQSNDREFELSEIKVKKDSLTFELTAEDRTYYYELQQKNNVMKGKVMSSGYEFEMTCDKPKK